MDIQDTNNKIISAKNKFQELDSCLKELEACQQRARQKFGASLQSLKAERWSLRTTGDNLKLASGGLKQLLLQFANQCKNEWVSTCQQFLALFGRILGVYQIKLCSLEERNANLEQKLSESNRAVTILQELTCTLREKIKYREMALLGEQQEGEIESLWEKSERKGQSQRKTEDYKLREHRSTEKKRVRISDVIAGYSQQSSISSYHFNSCGYSIAEQEHETQVLAVPQALVEITDIINRQSGQLKTVSPQIPSCQRGIQMSVIFSGQEEEDLSPIKEPQFRKYSLRQKENVSHRNRDNGKTSKITTFHGPTVRAKESLANYTNSSGAKLEELRKSLLQRKRSQHLL